MITERQDAELEQRCQAMGDVLAQTIPAAPEGAEGPLPDRLERVATRPRRGGRARRFLAWGPATVAVAAVAALIMVVTRPLGYDLEGAVASRDDRFETAPGGGATVRFTDGTSIVVGQRSAARIKERTPRGATFQLEHGRAALAVVHRPSADWHVEAGPFEIAVTGTRFDVRWSEDRDSLEVVMRAGSTIVRGSLAGAGIPLHAGQRLVASLSRKALVVNPLVDSAVDDDPHRRPAPPPAAVPIPPSEPPEASSPARPRRERAGAPARGAKRNLASSDRRTAPPPIPPPRPIEDPVPEVLLAPPEPPEPLPEPAVPPPPPPAPATAAVLTPPPPPPAPPLPPSGLNGGGAACSDGSRPQLPFETLSEGFAATGGASSAFSSPVLDHSRSWCGGASLRFGADFNLDGTPDWQGQMPYQIGEATVILPAPIDIRHKTVVVHFYVDGPGDAEFNARIMADQYGKRTGDKYTPALYAGRWWTISTTFSRSSGIFETPGMANDYASRIVLRIDAVGTRRIWAGSIYIDDISWR